MKDKVLAILNQYKNEMEGYSYFGSNPGVSEDDFEDIADKISIEVSEHTRELRSIIKDQTDARFKLCPECFIMQMD